MPRPTPIALTEAKKRDLVSRVPQARRLARGHAGVRVRDGPFPAVLEEARAKGIELAPKYIPAEVFDKRAVERGQVVFHDISFIEATPRHDRKKKLDVAIELTDFSVYYTQGAMDAAIAAMKDGKSQVLCEAGQLWKVNKNKDGVVSREKLTKHWTDWVDYWAVDFDTAHPRKSSSDRRRWRRRAAWSSRPKANWPSGKSTGRAATSSRTNGRAFAPASRASSN